MRITLSESERFMMMLSSLDIHKDGFFRVTDKDGSILCCGHSEYVNKICGYLPA